MKRVGGWLAKAMKGGKPMWYVLLAIFLMSMLLAKAVAEEQKKLEGVAERTEARRTIAISATDGTARTAAETTGA